VPTSEMVPFDDLAPKVGACPDCGDIYEGEHRCAPKTSATTNVLAFNAMAPLSTPGHLGTKEEVQDELDGIAAAIRQFHIKQPDQVMRECSAYGARLTEMCVLLHRVESLDRQYIRVRTQQVERYLAEIDRQFKTASRLVEVLRQDLELMK